MGSRQFELTWLAIASREGIASESFHTIANGAMIIHPTFRILTANIRTWIDAFLIVTRFVVGTFRADNTFWTTARWAPNIVWQARANRLVIDFSALRVGAARGGLTWVNISRSNRCMKQIWLWKYAFGCGSQNEMLVEWNEYGNVSWVLRSSCLNEHCR